MDVSKDQPRLTFSLSREELFVLLKLLKTETLVGVDLSDFQVGSDGRRSEQATQALNSAFRALVAREILTPLQADGLLPLRQASADEIQRQDWSRVRMRPEVMALVAACVFPARSIHLSWRKAGEASMLYVHEREGLPVLHTSPLPGIYTFTALADWEAVWQTIERTLGLRRQREAEPSASVVLLSTEALANVRDELRHPETGDVLSWLTQGGLSVATARALLTVLMQPGVVAGLTVLPRGTEQPCRCTIMVTAEDCFLLSPRDAQGEFLEVCHASAQEVRLRIRALCCPPTSL